MQGMIMQVANGLLTGYVVCIFYYIMSSWAPALRTNVIGKWVTAIVEPYLNLFRFIPPIGMIDISPIVAIFVLNIVSEFFLIGLNQLVTFLL